MKWRIGYKIVLRINGLCLDLKCFQQTSTSHSPICSHLVDQSFLECSRAFLHHLALAIEQAISNFSLQNYVLVEKFDLVFEISLDDLFEHPYVSQVTSLIKYDFHFLRAKDCIVDHLERWVAAEHLQVEVAPLFAYPRKNKLAIFHTQKLEY